MIGETPTLSIPDQRMIELIEFLIATGDIPNRQAFLDEIGLLKQNYREVTTGKRSFRVEHITRACLTYHIDANWIHGLSEVMRTRALMQRGIAKISEANKLSNKNSVSNAK